MPDQIKILTARRAYEFGPDELRLSALSIEDVRVHLRSALHFSTGVVGRPMQTFGPIPQTIPPGIVFDVGGLDSPEGHVIPIRFLHVDSRRIIIDVAGRSTDIDTVFERFVAVANEVPTPDGSPVIGEPRRVLDYSEITAHFDVDHDALLSPALRILLRQALGGSNSTDSTILLPTIIVRQSPASAEAEGSLPPIEGLSFQLAIRAGSRPSDRVFFSGAPLDTDQHLHYFHELEKVLRGSV